MRGGDLERGGEAKDRAVNSNNSYPTAAASSYTYDTDTHWISWLVPIFVVVNIAVFIVTMYINNCPENHSGSNGKCVARFLRRFSFQPLQENPLFGPSSLT